METNSEPLDKWREDAPSIRCDLCLGKYELISGQYNDVFARCSNYPKCNSIKCIYELIADYICEYGIGYYKIDDECEKCSKITPLFDYFHNYDLSLAFDSYWDVFDSHGVFFHILEYGDDSLHGLNTLEAIDALLSKKYPLSIKKIKNKFDKTGVKPNAYINVCVHCGAIQHIRSRGFVAPRHEVICFLLDGKLDKYYVEHITCPDKYKQDFKKLLIKDLCFSE